MADEALADRIRAILASRRVTGQRMFGGICFMLDGNIALGAHATPRLGSAFRRML